MSHTYTSFVAHVIFSTKERIPYLIPDRRDEIFAYMGGILRDLGCEPLHINGPSDHVHAVIRIPASLAIANVVGKMKGRCSKWIHERLILPRAFLWQRGYAGFSVSASNLMKVLQYVANQEEHHRKLSFQDELRAILRRHAIEYDERYMWD